MTSELADRTLRTLDLAGRGGAGVVFRAIEAGGQTIALKLGHNPSLASAFAREGRHLALAASPRLAELVDVGWAEREGDLVRPTQVRTAKAIPFLATRWIEGRSPTRDDAHRSPLAVAVEVGEALADLHAVGVAHGDVKPENLIDTAEGLRLIDLGLSCSLHTHALEGGTPRYLARGDVDLGSAGARDLLALGLVIAEFAAPALARCEHLLTDARRASLPPFVDAICTALLSPTPSARPSAAWAAELARRALRVDEPNAARADRAARHVRAAYLRARLGSNASLRLDDKTPAFLAPILTRLAQAASLEPAQASAPLNALGPDVVRQWLLSLAGPAAIAWPVAPLLQLEESVLVDRLVALARNTPPLAWTWRDVDAAIATKPSQHTHAPDASTPARALSAGDAAELALRLSRMPADLPALDQIERDRAAPVPLVLAAANALRLRGEHGRALALLEREGVLNAKGSRAMRAEVLRRAGRLEDAIEAARGAIAHEDDADGSARAVLARIALDRGGIEEAESIVGSASTARLAEVASLCCMARGDVDAARRAAAAGAALASTTEEEARLAAVAGYVAHGLATDDALASYVRAAELAARAGAIEEEASYLTGVAAIAVGTGDLGVAMSAASRAALLWDHLDKPGMAARALLSRAAAHAVLGHAPEAIADADASAARARTQGDARAEAYAAWIRVDVATMPAEATERAEYADELLSHADASDGLRAAARLLRVDSPRLDDARREASDARARDDRATSTDARLDWLGARAEALVRTGVTRGALVDQVLASVVGLAEAAASIGARGRALGAAHELSLRAGRGELAQRLVAALGMCARELLRRAPPELRDAVRALDWVARASATDSKAFPPEQARDLERLIGSLGERERLGALLGRVVDALVLWAGVERGLLLLRAPDGRLVPRAARNLARADLTGEQLSLSQTLARRAMDAREPVVAVDAAGELSALHASVHALALRSVLAVPLIARGDVLGVVYLDDRIRRGAFGERELSWAKTIAALAALAIADARDQVLLRRAARKARRATEALTEALSHREAALEVAREELATARGARATRFQYDGIIGRSAAMQALLRVVDRVTTSDVPVLLFGESGSGKELIARAIHDNGPRSTHPFVSENCGAIPEGLLESALFGHVRGAFTGASSTRLGLFEVANRGTLFLDEIGEMSLGMQTKLLRVLEDGIVRQVGSERGRKVDVRVLAATHRDLEAMVRERTFREDLFYRLNIIRIRIPPLRERPDDIAELVRHFVSAHDPSAQVRVSAAAMDRLIAYAWPGNVRQLQNEVRRALVLCDGTIEPSHFSPEIGSRTPARDLGLNVRMRIDALESDLVQRALERTRGNQTQAAKLLGLSRFGLQKMIKRLGIERAGAKEEDARELLT
jgi:transcriptional regulator with GAF, ATPase, and Fis domain